MSSKPYILKIASSMRNASFVERSVWIQFGGMVTTLGGYFAFAANKVWHGTTDIAAFVPLFIVAVVLMIVILVAGHAVAAITQRPEPRDERDRLIAWRAESNTSWIVAVGVVAAIGCLVFSVADVWIAHVLLLSLFLSEVSKFVLQLVSYRRGR